MTLDEATAKVRDHLTLRLSDEERARGILTSIYLWPPRPQAGVRVAEVAFSNERGGAAFMQSDIPYGMAVCAATERAILAHLEGWDDEEIAYQMEILDLALNQE
jgi:hypothetical protein